MRFSIYLTLLQPLTWFVNAERKLPANLQVDLIFPHSETYAPTQWFPIVFGVQNLDAIWPLDIHLNGAIVSTDRKHDYFSKIFSLTYDKFADLVGPTPSNQLFYIPAINMTNRPTGSYTIQWEVEVKNRCFANNTNPLLDQKGWAWRSRYSKQTHEFSIASGAQLPDVEATINSCIEPEENTVAVRIAEVRKTVDEGRPCPVFETNNITLNKCAYKPVAAELAANVSTLMLSNMGCDEGTWQNITAPCPRQESTASLRSIEFGTGLVLALAFAAVFNIP